MAERQVTIDGIPQALSTTFLVLATQNPIESVGAYPLPEAQLDRFTMKLRIGYPDRASELELLARTSSAANEVQAEQVLGPGELGQLQRSVTQVAVEKPVREYLLDLAEATRRSRHFPLGLSPRGLLQWQRVSQAYALLQERTFVVPEDIQAVAIPVLSIRLASGASTAETAIASILNEVTVPKL
jgi:MoxR-like ATPase